MRKIRELLRLKFDLGLSIHKIAASLSIARSTVTECLRRAAAAGIGWPLPQELDDGQLEARLYSKKPPAGTAPTCGPLVLRRRAGRAEHYTIEVFVLMLRYPLQMREGNRSS